MRIKIILSIAILVCGCASNPYAWEKDYYEKKIIEKCKIHRPTDSMCNVFAEHSLRLSNQDGWMTKRFNAIDKFCAEKHSADDMQKQQCVAQARKLFWETYIDGMFKKQN